jgi:hypothetical protein
MRTTMKGNRRLPPDAFGLKVLQSAELWKAPKS